MGIFGVDARSKATQVVARHGQGWLRSKHAPSILAVISFTESVFAPILVDPFLIALILANPKRWRLYTIISVVASVIGGIVAYFLGVWFFDTVGQTVLSFYGLEEEFTAMTARVDATGFVFVLIGAFTPVPYKVVALASGMLSINFLTFLVASVIGRILRLGLVGAATQAVGPAALPLVRKYLYQIALTSGVVLIAYLLYSLF